MIGEAGDSELADFLKDWAEKHPTDPRRAMNVGAGDRAAQGTTP